MRAVYALYSDGAGAQRAVNGLREAGLADSAITVISDQPMEAYEFGAIGGETRIWYIASAGGFAGFAFSTWLTRMTELAWPLPTGNMPIVSWWRPISLAACRRDRIGSKSSRSALGVCWSACT